MRYKSRKQQRRYKPKDKKPPSHQKPIKRVA